MLCREKQLTIGFNKYEGIFEDVISSDSMWKRMKEEMDFSFIYDIIGDNYSSTNGRPAKDIIVMFKLLLLKASSGLSDVSLVKMVNVNLEYKYFLDLNPNEINIIDPSLLTKFRRERLVKYKTDKYGRRVKVEDSSQKLMDILVAKTVNLALEKGIMDAKNIGIVDSTHSMSMYGPVSPREKLIQVSKKLRKKIYQLDEGMKEKMPKKREASGILEDELLYCSELLDVINNDGRFLKVPSVEENINLLQEIMEDTELEIEYSKDQDAKIGHKTADTAFFGYKTHFIMSEERIITSAVVTTGEKTDGKQLKKLVRKTEKNGIELEAIVGDKAYSEEENLKYCKNKKIKNVSKLCENVVHGMRKKEDKLEFNKDAGMYVCKAGHMAIRKASQKSHGRDGIAYYFDVEKCKHCPLKEGCYKDGAKSKSYYVKLNSNVQTKQKEYMETEEFKEYYSHRYKIEAKNGEIKKAYNYGRAWACGKSGMTIQGATTLFLANMKRIYKLEDEKNKKKANNSTAICQNIFQKIKKLMKNQKICFINFFIGDFFSP